LAVACYGAGNDADETVLHSVLAHFTAGQLIPVRLVCSRLRDLASSNSHWRRCLLLDLVPTYAALHEIEKIPVRSWAFSQVEDGWFRAYCEVKRVIRQPWLRGEDDLVGGLWRVYFKNHLRDTTLLDIEDPHLVIRFTKEHLAISVSGIPLPPRRWWLHNGIMFGSWSFRTGMLDIGADDLGGQSLRIRRTYPGVTRGRCAGRWSTRRS
jgi:hypothetical protein